MIIRTYEQGCLEWHQERLGKPSSSKFARLITAKGNPTKNDTRTRFRKELLGEMFSGWPSDDIGGIPAIKVGRERQPEGKARYEAEHDVDIVELGLVLDDDERWCASPDGVIVTDADLPLDATNLDTLWEQKNPGATNHCWYATQEHHLDAVYKAQVHGQMLAAGVYRAVLISNHPDMPQVVVPIVADRKYMDALESTLYEFLDELDAEAAMLRRQGFRATGLHPKFIEQWEQEQEAQAEGGWHGQR